MPAIPTTEPQSFTAGETVQWLKSLPEYPATTSTLKYAFQASGKALITFTGTASGAAHLIDLDPVITAEFAPGAYLWTSFAEVGSARYTVARGTISILPSPLAALGSTHASRMLALIESALEGRIPNGLESTNIDGQQLDRIPVVDLNRLRSTYETKVASEANAASMAAGLGNRRNSYARFTRVA